MNINLPHLFNVFSNRPQPSTKADKSLTVEFRNRIVFLCRDTFDSPDFWREVHHKLQYLHGRQFLSAKRSSDSLEDVANFFGECSDKHFLDFVELIFQPHQQSISARGLVRVVNEFLKLDDLPYSLTDFVWVPERDSPYSAMNLVAYPHIIRRDNEVLHNTAIEPTLTLLTNPAFTSANKEYLEALAHYRKTEYADCLSKCGSSFESVMKVICDLKSWSYKQTDTASTLLSTILPKTSLDTFFKEPLTLIATVRNRLSSAHGAGTAQRVVSKQVANYAINATASAILLLVEETNP